MRGQSFTSKFTGVIALTLLLNPFVNRNKQFSPPSPTKLTRLPISLSNLIRYTAFRHPDDNGQRFPLVGRKSSNLPTVLTCFCHRSRIGNSIASRHLRLISKLHVTPDLWLVHL